MGRYDSIKSDKSYGLRTCSLLRTMIFDLDECVSCLTGYYRRPENRDIIELRILKNATERLNEG